MKHATVRLYGALNDFLPRERRGVAFDHAFSGRPAVKDVLESLGVPHPELDVVLVDERPVDFAHPLEDRQRLVAYPPFHALPREGLVRVGPPPLEGPPRFLCDVGLGALARLLRMLGFDARWFQQADDPWLARTAREEGRVLLSRDVGLLKRAEVVHGYFPRSTDPPAQLVEVVRRYRLGPVLDPFSRCLECNAALHALSPDEARARVPAAVHARHTDFRACPRCGRVYWQGTHHARMDALVQRLRALED